MRRAASAGVEMVERRIGTRWTGLPLTQTTHSAFRMIRSVKSAATRQLVEGGRSMFRGLDEALARQRLAELNAAFSLRALSPLRSVALHKLKGDRAGFWAMSVNGPWLIVFRFEDGNAYEVEIVDYH